MTELVREVAEFFVAADAFCELMWEAETWSREERLRETAARLAALYAAALALPKGEDLGEEAPEIDDDERPDMAPFHIFPHYANVSSPLDVETSPTRTYYGSLAENLELVCRDAEMALAHFESGRVGYAVFYARRAHESHWGTLAVNALRALHVLLHPGEYGP